jgi:hypothetical protein
MMRLALFETSEVLCSIALDKLLHVLTSPHLFRLPLLRSAFAGGIIYQGQVVPLLADEPSERRDGKIDQRPAFALVCEAEYGLVAVPADRIVRITKTGEVCSSTISECDPQSGLCEIDGRGYHLLDLNRVLEDPDFKICGLKN